MVHNKRALRRHHKIRLNNRRKKYSILSGVKDERTIGMLCSTPTCSCFYCRNRREDEGPTLQEVSNDISFKEELKHI